MLDSIACTVRYGIIVQKLSKIVVDDMHDKICTSVARSMAFSFE